MSLFSRLFGRSLDPAPKTHSHRQLQQYLIEQAWPQEAKDIAVALYARPNDSGYGKTSEVMNELEELRALGLADYAGKPYYWRNGQRHVTKYWAHSSRRKELQEMEAKWNAADPRQQQPADNSAPGVHRPQDDFRDALLHPRGRLDPGETTQEALTEALLQPRDHASPSI